MWAFLQLTVSGGLRQTQDPSPGLKEMFSVSFCVLTIHKLYFILICYVYTDVICLLFMFEFVLLNYMS